MMSHALRNSLSFAALALAATAAVGQVGGTAVTRLRAFEEVPALSTPGGGRFSATINDEGTEMTYELEYFNLEGAVTQSHIHLGQRSVNGGIVIFLCSNLGNGPAGTQECPASPGTISGTITADNVSGANAQGLGPGELTSVLRAIRAGVSYVNVHTTIFPGGEIRGQLAFSASD